MRITQHTMVRNYVNGMNDTMSKYNDSINKLIDGRSFTKMSQNVTGGAKAMKIRSQLYQNTQMQENVDVVNEKLSAAENNLMGTNDMMVNVHTEALKIQNGTNSADERKVLSEMVTNYKDEVLKMSNSVYGDEYIFGGTNNAGAPFTIDETTGKTFFNGIETSKIYKDPDDSKFYYDDDDGNKTLVPESGENYIDIGLGMSVNGGKLDKKSAFNSAVSGLNGFGYGSTECTYTDASGNEITEKFSNNVHDIFDEIGKAIDNNDMERVAALDQHLTEQTKKVLVETSSLGVRTNYLDTTKERLDNEELTLTTMKQSVEGINENDEITNWKSNEYAWRLTLQFGSNFLPQSLMDYIS